MKMRDWGVAQIKELRTIYEKLISSHYSIIYSGKEEFFLKIGEHEEKITEENFYFIAPNSKVTILGAAETAILIWFRADLFVDRLEFLKLIKKGLLFKQSNGLLIKNNFMPYECMLKSYYEPAQNKRLNKMIAKNLFINFLEFVLIRAQLEYDAVLEEMRNNTYEKELINRFVMILQKEGVTKLKIHYYADQLGVTKRTLDNAMQEIYGCSTKKFLTAKIVEKAKKILKATDVPIKLISLESGFSEESNFSNFFKKNTGYSPRKYRQKAIVEIPSLK